ncbi:hypothetical protein ASF88_04380 [Leifsonia sp. Leaf336]|uniref:hypothetical protein n=1 Tax=Leifsonia sp. Leaf336 TaxID=1736341 RepID=UPI0006FB4876|nr:hypothetical protein [Leifsonia sp. Leaf336]KQR54077.1 hypothetical protein ASF88_04380 [Leifsonia sp. Leaf336]
MSRGRRAAGGALVAAVVLAGALAGIGAVPLPAQTARTTAAPASLCIPIFTSCSSPTPTPSPSPSSGSPAPGLPLPGLPAPTPTVPGVGTTPTPAPAPAVADGSAPVFTQPPAQLGSQSLSFTGLQGISLVTVPLADGSRIPVLKISADTITIQGFSLTVRKQTGPSLSTTADTMTLSGHVEVYLDSATATGPDGKSLTLGAATPPPNDGLPTQLLRVTLGLVGTTADSITYSNTKQHLSE